MIASPQPSFSTEEYLQMEEHSPIKHEYRDGDIYDMAGANDAHVTITLNLAALLRSHVRGSGCRIYITDMKARLEKLNRFYYPDILVTCDPRDQETATYKCFPKLIIEVLSDSTEAFEPPSEALRDRGDKFADYQTLESLQEYVLINTNRQRVNWFRRNAKGLWELQFYFPAQTTPEQVSFQLQSIGFEGAIADIYEDVIF